jgi:L-ascorbate metabolism protein UlaG (beta-lactamase superfamily)
MKVRRLSWAGIEIETHGRRLVVDAMDNTAPLEKLLGKPHWPPVAVPARRADELADGLVTHRHLDHYDQQALKRTLGPHAHVFCPTEIVVELEEAGLNARGVATWETLHPPAAPDVAITAVPAVDWRGDAQVSWVIDDGSHRIFHGGDTIWHGSWWKIAERFGRFDAAFLPVNGVVAHFENMRPSNLPATLTPQQAAVAARLLNADFLCPIHYRQFNNSATYIQYPDVESALERAAAAENVELRVVQDGAAVI